MYMPSCQQKIIKIKGYKIMYEWLNCDRKSQLSEILIELLNPRVLTDLKFIV